MMDHDYHNRYDEIDRLTDTDSLSFNEKTNNSNSFNYLNMEANQIKMSPDDFSHALFLTESGFFEEPTVFEEHKITASSFPKLIPSISPRNEIVRNSISELARSQGISEVDIVIFSSDITNEAIADTLAHEQNSGISGDIPFVFDMDMEPEGMQIDLYEAQNTGQLQNIDVTTDMMETQHERSHNNMTSRHRRRRHPAGDRNAAPVSPKEWSLL